MLGKCAVLLLAMVAGCGAGGAGPAGDDDGAQSGADARLDDGVADAEPGDSGDGGLLAYECHVLDLTPAQTCAIAFTGEVTPCSIDPGSGTPSQTGWLEVRKPDGSNGYLCSDTWSTTNGAYYNGDRAQLVDAPAACCGGPLGTPLDWPETNPYFGVPHGPAYIKAWETMTDTGGAIRENPFAVIVSSPTSAAAFHDARLQWQSWGGDGQPHPAPDGTGSYYFPQWVLINYIVVPTVTADPVIVIAPQPSLDAAFTRPLGHPTLGACADHGGAPLAFFGGEVHDTVITNHSGRFSAGSSTTAADLDNTATLFNCYGITVTGVEFNDPGM